MAIRRFNSMTRSVLRAQVRRNRSDSVFRLEIRNTIRIGASHADKSRERHNWKYRLREGCSMGSTRWSNAPWALMAIEPERRRSAWPRVARGFRVAVASLRHCSRGLPSTGRGLSEERRSRSARNLQWREPQLLMSDRNRSPEVTLERALMDACVSLKRHDWTNQVPLVSGLEGPDSHRRRAIDLVHRRDDRSIEFVELKVSSDITAPSGNRDRRIWISSVAARSSRPCVTRPCRQSSSRLMTLP